MSYTPQSVWVPVKPYFEVLTAYTPVRFVQEFGPCSTKHVATRIGWALSTTSRSLLKAFALGLLVKTIRNEEVNHQQRRVAFYSGVTK